MKVILICDCGEQIKEIKIKCKTNKDYDKYLKGIHCSKCRRKYDAFIGILKTVEFDIPFSMGCFLCAEKLGYYPECEKINATYTHEEKRKILEEKGIDYSKLDIKDFNKPCM